MSRALGIAAAPSAKSAQDRARALGVTVEANYQVGEYDIVILSAKQSDGLETWLTENGYKIPPRASRILGIYLKQNMRFFVARVNLKEHSAGGFKGLRPLSIAARRVTAASACRLSIPSSRTSRGRSRMFFSIRASAEPSRAAARPTGGAGGGGEIVRPSSRASSISLRTTARPRHRPSERNRFSSRPPGVRAAARRISPPARTTRLGTSGQ